MANRWHVLVCAGLLGACDHTLDGPRPSLAGPTTPHLVCNRQLETVVALMGDGLSPMVQGAATEPRLELPRVTLLPSAGLDGSPLTHDPIAIPDDSAMPASSHVRWLSQQAMLITIDESLAVPDAVLGIRVVNPNGHETTFADALVAVPPPMLLAVEPMAICFDDDTTMVRLHVRGAGFLRIADTPPRVPTVTFTAGTSTLELRPDPASMMGCTTLPAPATDAESCSSFEIEVSREQLPVGSHSVVVTNPDPAGCHTTQMLTVDVRPAPDLTDVTPRRICTGGGRVDLVGTDFRDGATVRASDGTASLEASSVAVAPSGTSAQARFGPGLGPGTYDVTITNPEGCSDTLTSVLEVVEGPMLFWVDPPVVYDGIATQITIYVSGAGAGVDRVHLTADDGTEIDLAHSDDLMRGRIRAFVPAGTTPGTYDVTVEAAGCPAVLPDGLRITDTLGPVTVTAIDPSFGRNDAITPVAIAGDGFVSVPRAYLNPATPGSGTACTDSTSCGGGEACIGGRCSTVATALRSVSYVDARRLTAAVPADMAPGRYDLIVVNPDGTVAILEDAFTVTVDPPPVIDAIEPGEVDNNDPATVTATGSSFSSPSSEVTCRRPDGTTVTVPSMVTSSTTTRATIRIDVTGLPQDTVCVVRLTNPDGSYGEFSALSITTPASNLQPTTFAPSMRTARRAPAVVAGRATRQARFLYAIGGDSGTDAGAFDTAEAAPLDHFGQLGDFFELPYRLPGPRTRAHAQQVGGYVFVVGGTDGTGPLASVLRAQVLSPFDAPIISDIGVTRVRGRGPGLGPGVWSYRVSAVYPDSDPINPGGESLASDPLVVDLPETLPENVAITLFWSMVPRATAYRIYRTPAADAGTGAEELIATVPSGPMLQYEDLGNAPIAAERPLPLGSLGRWATMPSLGSARAGLALAHGVDPMTPNVHYLYAIGGTGSGGTNLATYEYLSITLHPDGTQTVGASWIAGTSNYGTARRDLGSYSVDHSAAPAQVPPGTTYIYAVGGQLASGMASSEANAATIAPGGGLGTWRAVNGPSPRNAGFAHTQGNGFLYLFGGGPTPATTAQSAELCDPGSPTCTPAGQLTNWNNQGFALLAARYLARATVESAHIFVVGGVSASGAALASVETTVW